MSASRPATSTDTATMDPMPTAPAHAKPRDHLWVLVIIAVCCLVKVWPSWVGIGAEAGFPDLGKIPTDWTLAVVIEAYWAYAVYAWLAAPAGKWSRRFAMWSAAGVFALSLVGQSAAQVMAAKAVVVFANALPVIVLALIAVLVHLRRHDREAAIAAGRKRAEGERAAAAEAVAADERTALRAELAALTAEVEPLREALAAAQRDVERADAARKEAAQKADDLARKLAAKNARNARPKGRATQARNGGATARAKQAHEEDVDARTEALKILANEPDISGAQLGLRVGMSKRWGQDHKPELAAMAADLEETS